jgi:hypothetical protein
VAAPQARQLHESSNYEGDYLNLLCLLVALNPDGVSGGVDSLDPIGDDVL